MKFNTQAELDNYNNNLVETNVRLMGDKTTCLGEVFKDNRIVVDAWLTDNPRQILRGYATTFFGQLVNDGLLDAKKKGKFTVFSLTSKGEDLLRNCGTIQ